MWAERADYGHFFYRIPNGESAADAYDRVSGFNESLWRQFGEADFPSVCVLVTHGLMTRVFLMKWYHWSVEYFEDLRNVNHCEFVVMHKNPDNGKYILENTLRTWSELKRQRREEEAKKDPQRRNTLSNFLKHPHESPKIPPRKWGGCAEGCNHGNDRFGQRTEQRKEEIQQELRLPPAAAVSKSRSNEADDDPTAAIEPAATGKEGGADGNSAQSRLAQKVQQRPANPSYLHPGRDGGGTTSGAATPHEMSDDESPGYFPNSLAAAMRRAPRRKATTEDIQRWAEESGMGAGKQADALGDEPEEWSDERSDSIASRRGEREDAASRKEMEKAEKDDRSLLGSVY